MTLPSPTTAPKSPIPLRKEFSTSTWTAQRFARFSTSPVRNGVWHGLLLARVSVSIGRIFRQHLLISGKFVPTVQASISSFQTGPEGMAFAAVVGPPTGSIAFFLLLLRNLQAPFGLFANLSVGFAARRLRLCLPLVLCLLPCCCLLPTTSESLFSATMPEAKSSASIPKLASYTVFSEASLPLGLPLRQRGIGLLFVAPVTLSGAQSLTVRPR